MPSVVRHAAAFALLAAVIAATLDGVPPQVHAQPDPPAKDDDKARSTPDDPKPGPKAEFQPADPKTLRDKFRAEREESVKVGFPPESLTRADALAGKGEKALEAGDLTAASGLYHDARWQLPYLPPQVPPHVERILGDSRMRQADRVNAIAYSPDGHRLASASRDGTVRVWDLGNGRQLSAYRGHLDPDDATKAANVLQIGDVAFSPVENLAASTGGSQVHLWDPDTGKLVKVLFKLDKADRPLKAIAFSPDGKFLAIGGDDGVLRVVEVATGKTTFTGASRNARIEKVAYSPNGKLIAVTDSGPPNMSPPAGQVAVYAPGAANTMPMSVQAVEYGEAYGVAFTADNSAVFTSGRDGRVRLTGGPTAAGEPIAATGSKIRDYCGPGEAVFALTITPDGKYLVTGGKDRTVRVWDVATAKPVRAFHGHMGSVTAVAVRADGRQVASASDDGAIRLWDLTPTDDNLPLTGAADALWSVAYSPDGKRIAAAGADKIVRVYDAQTGKLEVVLTGHTAPVTGVAFFPDSNRLVSAGGDRVVHIWDVAANKTVETLTGHTSAVLAVAVSDDGKWLVSGSPDRTLRGWDAEGGKQLWAWSGKAAVCTAAIRKDGRFVAGGLADGTLVVLDVSAPGSPREVFHQPAHIAGVACAAYSPDGHRLVTVGGDGKTRVWSVADNGGLTLLVKFPDEPVRSTTPPPRLLPLTGVAFSPDGRLVATAGADTVIHVWNIQTRMEVRGLRAHTEWATAVAFSPDGQRIVSAGVDKTARVFKLNRPEVAPPPGHQLAVTAAAVSPDGSVIATAGRDQTIKLWDRATGRELNTLLVNADAPLAPIALAFLGNDGLALGTLKDTNFTGRLMFWTTRPGRLGRVLTTGEVYSAAGAPDGSRVAVWAVRAVVGEGAKNSSYEVYDRTGELMLAVKEPGKNVKAAAFTPDLGWVIAGDETGAVWIWNLVKKERVGDDWALFAGEIADVGLTPDRKHLVAIDRKGLVKVADVAKRETLAHATAHPNGVRGLVVSPTGDTFVTIGADREVKLWSLKNLPELQEVRAWKMPAPVNGAAYTPDGKSVVTANADGTAYVLELP